MPTKSRKTKPKSAARGGPGRKPVTKRDQLIRLLQARGGHDIAALSSKLGWQPHTTRAALSRLRHAGYTIEKRTPLKCGGMRYRIVALPKGSAR
jgi:hypothetical protein